MNVLITGITGMVGSHLADYLLENTDWKKVKYLIFEGGGSKQRDNVAWMRRQNRKKIVPALNVFKKKSFEV
jgi:nucleoside-diphosphate-sugar epimerase